MSTENLDSAQMSPEGGPEGQLEDAAARLGGRLDEVTQRMVDRILKEVPVYRRLPAEELSNVEQLAARNCRVLTEALMTNGHLNREDLRFVADHARERVRRGVSLESMLHAYRVGLTAFWEECIAEGVALGFSRDTALELARRTSELSDDLTTHAAETYVREEARLRARSDQAARDMLDLMLRGEVDVDSLKASRVAPGLDSVDRLVVAMGRVAESAMPQGDALEAASQAIARALSTGHASSLIAVRTGAVVAVAPLEDGISVAERLSQVSLELREQEIELFCGISMPRRGLGGVPVGFDQAALSASQASRERPVVSFPELSVIENLMLGVTGTTRAMLAEQAQEMSLGSGASLREMNVMLTAFANANMNVTRAAKDLHIHPNTLRYRLRRIEERTGRDPHSFGDLLDLICLSTLLDSFSEEAAK